MPNEGGLVLVGPSTTLARVLWLAVFAFSAGGAALTDGTVVRAVQGRATAVDAHVAFDSARAGQHATSCQHGQALQWWEYRGVCGWKGILHIMNCNLCYQEKGSRFEKILTWILA